MSLVMFGGLLVTVVSLVCVPIYLCGVKEPKPKFLRFIYRLLLWAAGVICGFMSLIALAAAAWEMDTRVPWGLSVYMYLIPAMSLPSFLLLRFISIRAYSRLFWLLTIVCVLAWYFGDQAERAITGLGPRINPMDRLRMLNAFTMIFLVAAVLIRLAAAYKQKQTQMEVLTGE